MFKLITAAALTAAALSLSACATTGSGNSYAGPHSHSRDAKQGVALTASSSQPAPKVLHDHREMK